MVGNSNVIEPLRERLVGRYLLEDFCDENGNVLVSKDQMMGDAEADLTDIPTSGWNAAPFGSKAFCIAEGTTHYLDSTGTWVDPTATPETTPDAGADS